MARLAIGINATLKECTQSKSRILKLQAIWMRRGDAMILSTMDFSTGDRDFNIEIKVKDIFGGPKVGVEPFGNLDLKLLQVELRKWLNFEVDKVS